LQLEESLTNVLVADKDRHPLVLRRCRIFLPTELLLTNPHSVLWASIALVLLQRNIKWLFNPPSGSHFGGVWERCIRTVRKILVALIKEQPLDDEGLTTLMCKVEAIINGHPITKSSEDPLDAEALTPNHLLLLHPGSKHPPGVFVKEDSYSHRRWHKVQYLANTFWRRWIREYLPVTRETEMGLSIKELYC